MGTSRDKMKNKGHKRHNWKTRWFVLFENVLCYYKSNRDTVPKGEINLHGCSVVSPCPEYTKRESVFRLLEHNGREFLIQCDDEFERENWTTDIGEVIRKLEAIGYEEEVKTEESPMIVKRNIEVSPETETKTEAVFGIKVTYKEMLDAMQDADAGVHLTNHTVGQETFKLCFTVTKQVSGMNGVLSTVQSSKTLNMVTSYRGIELIDWLISWAFVKTREDGHAVACELLEKAHIHPVGPLSCTSFKRKQARKAFCDSEQALYRFSSLRFSGGLDIDFDLNEDSEDSSDSEVDCIPSSVNESDDGSIIKQGFLVKKGHVRHNWKVRKFVLRDDPPSLFYYKPSKKNALKGRINLKQCEVTEIGVDEDEEDVDVSCAKGCKKYRHEHCFQIKTKKGTMYTLQAPSEEELDNWLTALEEVLL